MTILGWVFLVISWGFIISMLVYCFYRVFSAEKLD
jgi:glycerol uptake facilitator-like aquaporin